MAISQLHLNINYCRESGNFVIPIVLIFRNNLPITLTFCPFPNLTSILPFLPLMHLPSGLRTASHSPLLYFASVNRSPRYLQVILQWLCYTNENRLQYTKLFHPGKQSAQQPHDPFLFYKKCLFINTGISKRILFFRLCVQVID